MFVRLSVRNCSTFGFSRRGPFVQQGPHHENAFTSDVFLNRILSGILPPEVKESITPDLKRFGQRVSQEIWDLGQQCEVEAPYVRSGGSDAWGGASDRNPIVTSSAWKAQKDISAEEGLIAIPYENKQGQFSRLYQITKLYLYGPASGLFSCPLAMTDGAAKTLSQLPEMKEPFRRLTSRQPDQFWTSGQWMTEKRGGSDVGAGTETLAQHVEGDKYKLYGYKWFSSAADSNMSLTLGRIPDESGNLIPGSKGISMFYCPTYKPDGIHLNNIQVVKIKNKLGTRQLPTAELLIDGADAVRISEPGRGIPSITTMLSITRLHNIVSSCGAQRKILQLARDYATKRIAFGKPISEHPLHIQTLSRMETETQGCVIFQMELAKLLGLEENNKLNEQDELILRLMVPVAKYYTAKKAVANTSEGIECFGGQGYIEDTGIPGFLRDAQVLSIWEGTSTVMSLDVLRAIVKSNGQVLKAFKSRIEAIIKVDETSKEARNIQTALNSTLEFVQKHPELTEISARDLATSLAEIYIAGLLFEHSRIFPEDEVVSKRWSLFRDLSPVSTAFNKGEYSFVNAEKDFVYQGYDENNLFQSKYIR